MPTKHKKSWILVKGCEYNPERTLVLGQILIDPRQPSQPLLPYGPFPIRPDDVERSRQAGVNQSSGSLLEISFSVWAEVDLLPITGELGGGHTNQKDSSWSFDALEGQIVVPRIQDVKEALESETVTAHLHRTRFNFRKRLYIITGIRVAKGARKSQSSSVGIAADIGGGVDLAAVAGVPVNFGAGVGVSKASYQKDSFTGASDFVYAYRVNELHYGKDVYSKPYTVGDSFGVKKDAEALDDAMDTSDDEDEDMTRILVEGISETDHAGGMLRLSGSAEDTEEDYFL
jgi:hypothetical protein